MGRQVQGPRYDLDARRYVPKAFANRDDPEPVEVWLKTATEGDRRAALEAGIAARMADGDESMGARSVDASIETLLRRCVVRVERYTDTTGRPILTGVDLARHGEPLLVYEVNDEIRGALSLTEDEKKTSPESPPSTSEKPAPSNGAAASAGAPASMVPAAADPESSQTRAS